MAPPATPCSTKTQPFNPVTPYGVSKVRAEGDLLKLASERFSPVLLRSATAYGASPRLRCDIVLNNLTAHAVATGKVLIKSDGTPWRPIVHVEDISRAFVAALEAPRDAIHAEAFNVGRPEENYRVRELAEIVRDTVPGCELEFAGDASPDTRNYRVDCSKIARALPNFAPQWTARKGAAQLYKALQRSRHLPGGDRRVPLPPPRPDQASPLGRRPGWHPAPQGRLKRDGIRLIARIADRVGAFCKINQNAVGRRRQNMW